MRRLKDIRVRVPFALGACVLVMACDTAKYASFAVLAPAPVTADSIRDNVFATVERLARRRGLEPAGVTDAAGQNPDGWEHCFAKPYLFLCGKVDGPRFQFELRQFLQGYSLRPANDSLRREVMDSLRSQFGVEIVVESK